MKKRRQKDMSNDVFIMRNYKKMSLSGNNTNDKRKTFLVNQAKRLNEEICSLQNKENEHEGRNL